MTERVAVDMWFDPRLPLGLDDLPLAARGGEGPPARRPVPRDEPVRAQPGRDDLPGAVPGADGQGLGPGAGLHRRRRGGRRRRCCATSTPPWAPASTWRSTSSDEKLYTEALAEVGLDPALADAADSDRLRRRAARQPRRRHEAGRHRRRHPGDPRARPGRRRDGRRSSARWSPRRPRARRPAGSGTACLLVAGTPGFYELKRTPGRRPDLRLNAPPRAAAQSLDAVRHLITNRRRSWPRPTLVATSTIARAPRAPWPTLTLRRDGGAAGDRRRQRAGGPLGGPAERAGRNCRRRSSPRSRLANMPRGARHRRHGPVAFARMTVVHPIARAWITTGGTGAQNYDEFADDAEITEIIAANPHSALAIEMPHRAPESRRASPFLDCLPDAVARLAAASGRRQLHAGRATSWCCTGSPRRTSPPAYGLWCMVDTDQISTSADEPGLVIRNEDVFIDKVRERVALAEAAAAPAVARPAAADRPRRRAARRARARATDAAGAPAATDLDQAGRTHAIWALGRRARCRTSCSRWPAAASWSSPTATTAAWPRRPAACRGSWPWSPRPASVAIQPYNRLVSELAGGRRWSAALPRPAARVEELPRPAAVPAKGTDRAVRARGGRAR